MLVYLKTGNKRTITRMKILVDSDHHSCLRCPYNPDCSIVCDKLENMERLQEKVKEEFGIGSCFLHITPLGIERMRAKFRPDREASNPYICNEKLNTEMGLASGVT
jgi:hypothetical protein